MFEPSTTCQYHYCANWTCKANQLFAATDETFAEYVYHSMSDVVFNRLTRYTDLEVSKTSAQPAISPQETHSCAVDHFQTGSYVTFRNIFK